MLFACSLLILAAEPTRSHVRIVETIALPATAGKETRVWIPLPYDADGQALASLSIPKGFALTRDAKTGNRFLYGKFAEKQSPATIVVDYTVKRTSLTTPAPNPGRPKPPKNFLEVWKQRDALAKSADLDALAKKLVEGVAGEFEKAKRIYDHVFDKMTYAPDAAGARNGDANRACSVGTGNCTDFHALFVALCHSAGIPARLESGLVMPGFVAKFHCWASFYDDARGWIAVDVSEAKKRYVATKNATDADRAWGFGKLDAQRIGFGRGLDAPVAPPAAANTRLGLYPVVEVDGKRLPVGDPKSGGVGVEFKPSAVQE